MSVEVLKGCETTIETKTEVVSLPEIVCDVAFPRPERVYPHALLVELKEHPVALRWPPYLDPIYKNARGVWDPDRWHHDRKRGDTPVIPEERERSQGEAFPTKRPREREIERVSLQQEEEDSIVLSPQRRSFLTGCQAAQDELVLKPEQPTGGRRVGSGRILARERDGGSRPDDFQSKPPARARNDRDSGRGETRDPWDGRDYAASKFSFRRDIEEDRRPDWDDRRNYYQHDDRRGGGGPMALNRGRVAGMGGMGPMGGGGIGGGMKRGRQESEPEWMSESVSMSDMIELRGFEDPKPHKPGMNLEEVEQLQKLEKPEKQQQPQQQPLQLEGPQQRSVSRASGKSDKEPPTSAALADFLKTGGRRTPTPPRQNLPSGLLEAIMGGGQPASCEAGSSFNFDSIMMESLNLNSLLGAVVAAPYVADGSKEGSGGAAVKVAKQQHSGPPSGQQQQSRFSQFFNKPAAATAPAPAGPPSANQQPSRRSSIQDELLGSNILREINGEATIRIPSPEDGGGSSSSSKYFTPISPAAKTGAPVSETGDLLDMLKKGGVAVPPPQQQQQPQRVARQLEDDIKRSLGLSEQQQPQLKHTMHHGGFLSGPPGLVTQPHPLLLHHLQQQAVPPLPRPHQHQQANSQDSDMSAFKKLVAQVKAAGPPATVPPMGPPMDAAAASLLGLIRPAPLPSANCAGVRLYTEQDIMEGKAKGQQQQRARFSHPAIPPPLVRFLDQYPMNLEILKRPDAEHLILGLNSGAISFENVVQQLSNPSLQLRQRELILTVLKLKTSGLPPPPAHPLPYLGGPALLPPRTSPQQQQQYVPQHHSTRVVSPMAGFPPSSAGGGATNHLAVSPVPPSQRVPSPQEMTVLTQHILQQALIKRKLEEQKENYRRRQGDTKQDKEDKENIRGGKNADASSSSSGISSAAAATAGVGVITGSPLAFTPTSVMRKNAAERKDSDPRLNVPGNQERGGSMRGESKQAPPSPGRPITKGKSERPDRLELGGMPDQRTASRQSPNPGMNPGLLGAAPGQPSGFNPLLFLQNPQARAPLGMGQEASHGQISGQNHLPAAFLAAAAAANNHRIPAAFLNNHPPAAILPGGGATPLSRFFSPDVLAAAQGGACPPMPPLPTRQALTLEEIERQAAAAAVRI